MSRIPEIVDSRYNHGTTPDIIMTCTVAHEVAFKPDDIVRVVKAMASDSMAKMINAIGAIFDADQLAEAYAADDLDETGRQFIDDMHYFIHKEEGKPYRQLAADLAAALANLLRADERPPTKENGLLAAEAMTAARAALKAYREQEGA